MSIIVALLVFSLLVVIHEWGHYIAAVKSGVHVEEFSVGMGPAIYKRQGKNTLFAIRILPIGGYCKMTGEDEASDDERAFCNRNVWQKIIIVVAGALMNIVSAYVILMVISNFFYVSLPQVESLTEGGNAEATGLLPGDIIRSVNGKSISIMDDARLEIVLDNTDDKAVDMTIERDGELISYVLPYTSALVITDVGKLESDLLVEKARVEEINGINVSDIKSVTDELKNENVTMKLSNSDETVNVTEDEIKILKMNAANLEKNVGIVPVSRRLNLFESIEYGFKKANYYVSTTYRSLQLILTRSVSKDQVSGPVGIIKVLGDTYENGMKSGIGVAVINLLSFAAMLSINLGVINLLPLPALDGGRFIILLLEVIRKKPMNVEKEGWIHFVGFVLLMILMVVIVFNDVSKLIGF